jgi:hypothetical protein
MLSLYSCSLIKMAAGADYDTEAYKKSREAEVSDIKLRETTKLLRRISEKDPLDNADIVFIINENLVNDISQQYIGVNGWIDDDNSFVTDSINISINYGYCTASLGLSVTNHRYGIDLKLLMFCLVNLSIINNDLYLKLEPYNISPIVETGFLLSGLKETIHNLVLYNLGEMGKKFKGIKLPLSIENELKIPENTYKLRSKVNADINVPEITIPLNMKLKEIIFLKNQALISFNFIESKVK